MKHKLKTVNPYFADIQSGLKNFEVRKNDRGYQVGDILILAEFCWDKKVYSGKQIEKSVSYILDGFKGLNERYVVLGLVDLELTNDK